VITGEEELVAMRARLHARHLSMRQRSTDRAVASAQTSPARSGGRHHSRYSCHRRKSADVLIESRAGRAISDIVIPASPSARGRPKRYSTRLAGRREGPRNTRRLVRGAVSVRT
jgi:hypothetical protein